MMASFWGLDLEAYWKGAYFGAFELCPHSTSSAGFPSFGGGGGG